MKRLFSVAALFLSFLITSGASARDINALFIGNSFTFYPGNPTDPEMPKMLKQIIETADSEIQFSYSYNTPGGYTLQNHLDGRISPYLLKETYDQVVIQPGSLEAVELTPYLVQDSAPQVIDIVGLRKSLPKVLDLAFSKNQNVTLFVTFAKGTKNEMLQEGHPGLYFPEGHPRAGQKWCGNSKAEYQKAINDGFKATAAGYPVTFAMVGDAWMTLQNKNVVTEDELYTSVDYSHPSATGTFISALVFAKDVFKVDIRKSTFVPEGMEPAYAKAIAEGLY